MIAGVFLRKRNVRELYNSKFDRQVSLPIWLNSIADYYQKCNDVKISRYDEANTVEKIQYLL
jgi:hypothetical protein